jgi:hypothetical protein
MTLTPEVADCLTELAGRIAVGSAGAADDPLPLAEAVSDLHGYVASLLSARDRDAERLDWMIDNYPAILEVYISPLTSNHVTADAVQVEVMELAGRTRTYRGVTLREAIDAARAEGAQP